MMSIDDMRRRIARTVDLLQRAADALEAVSGSSPGSPPNAAPIPASKAGANRQSSPVPRQAKSPLQVAEEELDRAVRSGNEHKISLAMARYDAAERDEMRQAFKQAGMSPRQISDFMRKAQTKSKDELFARASELLQQDKQKFDRCISTL